MAAQIKSEPLVVLVDRGRLQFFGKNFPQVLTLDLPPASVGDLEIKKYEDFNLAVKVFLEGQKIPFGPVFLIYSDTSCFSKEFPAGKEGETNPEEDKFLKSIPFDYLLFKKYKIGKTDKIVAINREFYDGIRSVLENLGFTVLGVIPAAQTRMDLRTGLTTAAGKEIIKRIASFQSEAMVLEEEGRKMSEEETSSDPRKNRKLLALLVVFILLVLVFAGLLVKNMLESKQGSTKENLQAGPMPSVSAQKVTPTPTATEIGASLGLLKVEVLNASGVTGQAETIKRQLVDLGFKNVETGNSTVINSDKIRAVFSATMSASVQQSILTKLSAAFPALDVSQATLDNFDLVITLTKTASVSASKTTP